MKTAIYSISFGVKKLVAVVELFHGALLIKGDQETIERMGIGSEPLRIFDDPPIDPNDDPELYFESLPLAYRGAYVWAENIQENAT